MVTVEGYLTRMPKRDNNRPQSYKIPFPVHSDTRHSKVTYNRSFTPTIKGHRQSAPLYTGKINHLPRTRQQRLENTVSKQYKNVFSAPQNTSISIIL
jgi:hypothetical protein